MIRPAGSYQKSFVLLFSRFAAFSNFPLFFLKIFFQTQSIYGYARMDWYFLVGSIFFFGKGMWKKFLRNDQCNMSIWGFFHNNISNTVTAFRDDLMLFAICFTLSDRLYVKLIKVFWVLHSNLSYLTNTFGHILQKKVVFGHISIVVDKYRICPSALLVEIEEWLCLNEKIAYCPHYVLHAPHQKT